MSEPREPTSPSDWSSILIESEQAAQPSELRITDGNWDDLIAALLSIEEFARGFTGKEPLKDRHRVYAIVFSGLFAGSTSEADFYMNVLLAFSSKFRHVGFTFNVVNDPAFSIAEKSRFAADERSRARLASLWGIEGTVPVPPNVLVIRYEGRKVRFEVEGTVYVDAPVSLDWFKPGSGFISCMGEYFVGVGYNTSGVLDFELAKHGGRDKRKPDEVAELLEGWDSQGVFWNGPLSNGGKGNLGKIRRGDIPHSEAADFLFDLSAEVSLQFAMDQSEKALVSARKANGPDWSGDGIFTGPKAWETLKSLAETGDAENAVKVLFAAAHEATGKSYWDPETGNATLAALSFLGDSESREVELSDAVAFVLDNDRHFGGDNRLTRDVYTVFHKERLAIEEDVPEDEEIDSPSFFGVVARDPKAIQREVFERWGRVWDLMMA